MVSESIDPSNFWKKKKKKKNSNVFSSQTILQSTTQGKQQPPYFQAAAATPNQKKKRPHLSIKCVNPSKQRMESMSEIANRMLDITKDMSKSIARMEGKLQDSWNQMIEVLDKQSNVLLELKEQSKDQEIGRASCRERVSPYV